VWDNALLGISGTPLGRPKSRKGEIGEFATCFDSRLCVLNTLASFRICPDNAVSCYRTGKCGLERVYVGLLEWQEVGMPYSREGRMVPGVGPVSGCRSSLCRRVSWSRRGGILCEMAVSEERNRNLCGRDDDFFVVAYR